MSDRILLTAALLALAPPGLEAQDWREMTSFRQRADETRLDVRVHYGAGRLVIDEATGGELYRAALRYDADLFDPIVDYDRGTLEVGIDGGGIRIRDTGAGELRLHLSPDVPLDLDLDFGAVEAELELGRLRVRSLDVETGASDTEVRFTEANRIVCDRLAVSMGAAAFAARGLANANCERLTIEGGVGDLTLEFDGTWTRDLEADITMALGSVTLRVPRGVGVRVDKDTFLTDFNGSGFSRRDGVHYSDDWDAAERRLHVDLQGAFGTVTVRWMEPLSATR